MTKVNPLSRRPAQKRLVVAVRGAAGTGKSYFAASLAEAGVGRLLFFDVERKSRLLPGATGDAPAFDAVEVVRDVLRTLEQQFVVVTLLGDLVELGLSVAIGGEHGVQPLSACSVVVAPVVVDECRAITDHQPWLTLLGLELVFGRNA